jgi:hypothetical protein
MNLIVVQWHNILILLSIHLQDNNLGLAKQVIASLYKRNIQRLTQTYLTLSLQDIADTVQLDSQKEAELHILQMVRLITFRTVFV